MEILFIILFYLYISTIGQSVSLKSFVEKALIEETNLFEPVQSFLPLLRQLFGCRARHAFCYNCEISYSGYIADPGVNVAIMVSAFKHKELNL